MAVFSVLNDSRSASLLAPHANSPSILRPGANQAPDVRWPTPHRTAPDRAGTRPQRCPSRAHIIHQHDQRVGFCPSQGPAGTPCQPDRPGQIRSAGTPPEPLLRRTMPAGQPALDASAALAGRAVGERSGMVDSACEPAPTGHRDRDEHQRTGRIDPGVRELGPESPPQLGSERASERMAGVELHPKHGAPDRLLVLTQAQQPAPREAVGAASRAPRSAATGYRHLAGPHGHGASRACGPILLGPPGGSLEQIGERTFRARQPDLLNRLQPAWGRSARGRSARGRSARTACDRGGTRARDGRFGGLRLRVGRPSEGGGLGHHHSASIDRSGSANPASASPRTCFAS